MIEPVTIEPIPFQGRRVECRLCSPADLLALTDWCDLYLAGDFHFKRRHMQNILERGTSRTFAVEVDGVFSGMLILYRGSMLHNLYLSPEIRGLGVGAAVLAHFKPQIVRAKTNMKDGDPTDFYEQNGYRVIGHDPAKPHITIMERVSRAGTATGNGVTAGQMLPAPLCAPSSAVNGLRLDAGAAASVIAAPATEHREQKRVAATERSRRRRERLKRERAAGAAPSPAQHTNHLALSAHQLADAAPSPAESPCTAHNLVFSFTS